MALYQELDNLTTQEEIDAYRKRLEDRFGKVPEAGEELMRVPILRQLGREIGFEKITLKHVIKKEVINGQNAVREGYQMRCIFVSGKDETYWDSRQFDHVINFTTDNPRLCRLEERKDRRMLTFLNVPTIKRAVELLKKIKNS